MGAMRVALLIICTLALSCGDEGAEGDSGGGDASLPRDGGDSGDGARDVSPSDSGDEDAATMGPADCPWNTGYPCTCTRAETCDDGTRCATLPWIESGLGVCVAECIPDQPPGTACPTHDFVAPAWCQIRAEPTGPLTHCLLVCAHSDNCPSDQVCTDVGLEGVLYCLPE